MNTSPWMVALFLLTTLTLGTALPSEGSTCGELEATRVVKKLQNPLADLMSFSFQNNLNYGYGYKEELLYNLNVQLVLPFHLTENWNVITRAVIPYRSNPWPCEIEAVGDTHLLLLFTSAKSHYLTWGVGPIFQFPTSTSVSNHRTEYRLSGYHCWCAGAATALTFTRGPWVVGATASNLWSFANEGHFPGVNQLLFEPFLYYNFSQGWYVASCPTITADWKLYHEDVWTIPLGGGFGILFFLGEYGCHTTAQAYYNVKHPLYGPHWQLRLQVDLLFPPYSSPF